MTQVRARKAPDLHKCLALEFNTFKIVHLTAGQDPEWEKLRKEMVV
jgi:hypothetical protein